MTVHGPITAVPSRADALLIDVAHRIQLPPSKYEEAQNRFLALCSYVDRPGSPLQGLVLECYGGGSFSTGTVIASKVSKNQHDIDAVLQLDVEPWDDPATILTLLFDAINGAPGSRYYGKVRRNSRCVTVTYEDGVCVDLMPIARLGGEPEKASHLFHWKPGAAESYHKPVNPWGFAQRFNEDVELDPVFVQLFEDRRLMFDAAVAKADTEPLPDQVPISEKSPRVVALQLLKRNRDLRYRSRQGRKPPSVMLCALALAAGARGTGLLDELLWLASNIAERLEGALRSFQLLTVHNPAYPRDIFTDRWPEDVDAQRQYLNDLRHLQGQLLLLRSDRLSATEMRTILEGLFGETAAGYAVERYLDEGRRAVETKGMRFGPRGQVLTGAAAIVGAATSTTARANTNMGGRWRRD